MDVIDYELTRCITSSNGPDHITAGPAQTKTCRLMFQDSRDFTRIRKTGVGRYFSKLVRDK